MYHWLQTRYCNQLAAVSARPEVVARVPTWPPSWAERWCLKDKTLVENSFYNMAASSRSLIPSIRLHNAARVEKCSALMSTAYKEIHPGVGYLPAYSNKRFRISDFLPWSSSPVASGRTSLLHKPIILPTLLCSLSKYAWDKKPREAVPFDWTKKRKSIEAALWPFTGNHHQRLTKRDILDKVSILCFYKHL